jgi:Flp pilus assembly protein TadD
MVRTKTAPPPTVLKKVTEWFRSHEQIAFLVLSGAWVLFLYWRTLSNPFSSYDDFNQIVNNPGLATWHEVLYHLCTNVWFTDDFRLSAGSYYRPLYWISLALDRKVWGLNAFGFHVTNLLLHWINGVLLFTILRRLRIPLGIAVSTPLLWLALPINSEVIAWIASRAYCLAGFFILLSVLLGQRFLETKRTALLALYALTAFCALLCNEAGVLVLPLTVLVVYATTKPFSRPPILLYVVAIVAAALYLGLKRLTGGADVYYESPMLLPFGAYFFKYFAWIVFPVHMSIERSSNAPADVLSLQLLLAWIGVVGILIAVFCMRDRWPIAAAGAIWMVIAITPFCGVVPIYQGMAERFLYFASAGLALTVAAAASRTTNETRNIVLGVVVLWAVWGIWRLQSRLVDWSDSVLLYRSSLEGSPNSTKLLYNLGAVEEKRGELADAGLRYRSALLLAPNFEQAIAGLGNIRMRLNDPKDAAVLYRKALSIKPNDAGAVTNYAASLVALGDAEGAEREYKQAIALSPSKDDAYCGLGVLLFQKGDALGATTELLKAQSIDPSDSTSYYDLGAVYQKSGQSVAAADEFKKALELKPGDPDTIAALEILGSQ